MSTNGSKDQNPWGKRPEQGPPDLFEILKKLFAGTKSTANTASGGDKPSGSLPFSKIVAGAVGLLVLLWIIAGIFVVKPAEQAVVLRFGKYVSTVGAGPHWMPALIDRRYIVNTQEVRNFPYRAEMLTADENIVSVAVAVQYRIAEPRDFLINVVNPIDSLQQATSSAVRQVVGQMTLDTILTTGRQSLRDRIATQLNKVLSIYNTGLEVTDMTLQPAKPPEEVTEAFDDAIKAREDEQRYINQAEAYVQQVTSIAKGQIVRLMQSANAYEKETVLQAQGKTARFNALLAAYKQAPAVTKERLYIDGIQSVLGHTHNVIVDSGHGSMLYLPLDQLLKQQKTKPMTQSQSQSKIMEAVGLPQVSSSGSMRALASRVRPQYPEGANQ